jgi:3-oxoacyl-[acyl-carrier protein] reductase
MEQSEGKLHGQVAIVTGAAQGMGAESARVLARQGARVVVCDLNGEKAKQVAREIDPAGEQALGLKTDVADEGDVAALVDATLERFGKIGILVNNAGVLRSTRVEEISAAEWDLVLDANLKGTFFCSKAVLANMKANKYGRIINMSSSAGRSVSTLGGAHYTTAKAGVLGFTRALAKEMAPFGITANSICPGLIDTEMVRENCSAERLQAYEESFPISRLGTRDEVARLVLFLAADAPYITGAAFDINGGDLMI